jgi:hypothetical protein
MFAGRNRIRAGFLPIQPNLTSVLTPYKRPNAIFANVLFTLLALKVYATSGAGATSCL